MVKRTIFCIPRKKNQYTLLPYPLGDKFMALVAPFRALRYNPKKIERIEDVITPPYDIISAGDGEKLRRKNPYSMINLDLRNTSQNEDADASRYQQAQASFAAWQAEDILIRDVQAGIYLYSIDYVLPGGQSFTRKGMVCLVGLEEFSKGVVRPHEKTFAGVIQERLKLMEHCQAQFSKVFSLYCDPEQEVIRTLEQAQIPEPLLEVEEGNGNRHRLWQVTDPAALARVQQFLQDKPVYIADGHHRYTTALEHRRRALVAQPDLPAEDPRNFIMMYLCAAEDPGLSVLPTHRLVRWPGNLSGTALMEKMTHPLLHREEIQQGSRKEQLLALVKRMNEGQKAGLPLFGIYHPGEDRAFLLRVQDKHPALIEKPAVLRELDVVILSELLLGRCLDLTSEQAKDISYISDLDEALDLAVQESSSDSGKTPLLFLLNATKAEQVLKVADQGEIMPHKSTFFYPKILTGLLINRLDEPVNLPK
jgi:uncharacterized protein (DUF1015 family)